MADPTDGIDDYLTFIELRPFTRRWQDEQLTDVDLRSLQSTLLTDPLAGDVVTGTGGLRKLRFRRTGTTTGKSGGYRVGYAHLASVGTIVLAVLYPKSSQANLSAAERAVVKTLLARIEAALLARSARHRSGRDA